MTFGDDARDFWVATAAAAPVIALGGLVLIRDVAVAGDMLRRARQNPEQSRGVFKGAQRIGPPGMWVAFYCIFTLLKQSFVLIVALLALLQGDAPIPGKAVIVVEGIGLFFLLLAATLAGQVGAESRRWEERREEKRTADAAEKLELAGLVASKFRTELQLASKPRRRWWPTRRRRNPRGRATVE